MNRNAKLYTNSIIVLGLFLLISNFGKSIQNINYQEVMVFFILVVISELFSVEASSFSNISLGFSVAFTMIVLLPPTQSSLIMFFGFIFAIFEENGTYRHIFNSSLFKRLFNASSYYVTAFISGNIYHYIDRFDTLRISNFGVFALIVTVLAYLFINSTIFMGLFAILSKMSVKDMILKNFWALKSFFTLSPLGIMMLLFYTSYGWFGLLLFFGPLFLARYSFKLYLNMKNIYFETIKALTKAIDAKDEYTKGHSFRVAEYAVMIGKELKMSEPRLEVLRTAGLLHDVGKIGISDNILLKPGKLSTEEMDEIKNHPSIGAKIIEDIEFLDKARLYVKQHHERYDGKGYPDNIKGEDMPIESCVLSVADAFDAMTTDRAYRKAFSEDKAIEILVEEREKQFSPKVVDAVLSIKKNQGSVIIYAD